MKNLLYILPFSFFIVQACNSQENDKYLNNPVAGINSKPLINVEGTTIHERFNAPEGYERVDAAPNSFAHYLRNLPLKPDGSIVKFYNGKLKSNNVYAAVIDLEIGHKDLHQCADAVMRLRAEHLWNQKQYDQIHFNFTNGFRVDYSKWMQGKRVAIEGNKTYWKSGGTASNSYMTFWKYMELIFSYAGTLSLDKELHSKPVNEMQIGDVFIHGGSPGHAVIIVDMAINKITKEKLFMIVQSYMPAQETQLLLNFNNKDLSPWYSVNFGEQLQTPEWNFSSNELKSF